MAAFHRLRREVVQVTAALLLVVAPLAARAADVAETAPSTFAFTVAGDMRSFSDNSRHDGRRFFDGACEAMRRVGPGAFLISPGDFDPPAPNRAVIDKYLGKDFPWYIVVGNHEVENATVMPWVREWRGGTIPHVVRHGPPGSELTLYSWDFGPAHFVAIDSYPFAQPGTTKGKVDLSDAAFQWLEEDLRTTRQPLIWVIGHQPIKSMPDMDSGRERHGGDSVSYDPARAARFVALLKRYHVRAYICGHTHDASITNLDGLWQCDSGHARGGGDTGSPSTFLKFRIEGERAWVDVYRADPKGATYTLRETVELAGGA